MLASSNAYSHLSHAFTKSRLENFWFAIDGKLGRFLRWNTERKARNDLADDVRKILHSTLEVVDSTKAGDVAPIYSDIQTTRDHMTSRSL